MEVQDGFKRFPKRTFMFSVLGLLVSIGVLAYTFTTVILLRSFWYVLWVVYYLLLIVMRFALLRSAHRNIRYPYHEKYKIFINVSAPAPT